LVGIAIDIGIEIEYKTGESKCFFNRSSAPICHTEEGGDG
jgi:hypothetical protein